MNGIVPNYFLALLTKSSLSFLPHPAHTVVVVVVVIVVDAEVSAEALVAAVAHSAVVVHLEAGLCSVYLL